MRRIEPDPAWQLRFRHRLPFDEWNRRCDALAAPGKAAEHAEHMMHAQLLEQGHGGLDGTSAREQTARAAGVAPAEGRGVITVAALYVDPRGPYPSMPGVECWDEQRDARLYAGPHPVVAHPPCGPWGRLHKFCTRQDPELGPLAVRQVRAWGGVLEHPKASRLWQHGALPLPGELPDECGGRSVEVTQVSWGHRAEKTTWLYVVGPLCIGRVELRDGGKATHVVTTSRANRKSLPECGKVERRLTPPAFAEFLVELARRCRREP